MTKCFMCGAESGGDDGGLEKHHLVPKTIIKNIDDLESWKNSGGTIRLCSECHEKTHILLEPFTNILIDEFGVEDE